MNQGQDVDELVGTIRKAVRHHEYALTALDSLQARLRELEYQQNIARDRFGQLDKALQEAEKRLEYAQGGHYIATINENDQLQHQLTIERERVAYLESVLTQDGGVVVDWHKRAERYEKALREIATETWNPAIGLPGKSGPDVGFPYGLRCGDCHEIIENGATYAHKPIDKPDIMEIVCVGCGARYAEENQPEEGTG